MIRIGDRITIEIGENNEETMVLFDGKPVGGIGSLRMELDSRLGKPLLDITMIRGRSIEPHVDFALEMSDHGFRVSVLDISFHDSFRLIPDAFNKKNKKGEA